MPTWLAIVLIVLAVLLVVFVVGGWFAVQRRNQGLERKLLADLARANEALAKARASDRGWDRDLIDQAARDIWLERSPDSRINAVHLVEVVDMPGTEHDQARVRIQDAAGTHDLLLGRRGDDWVAAG